jgi:hypothetical protein
MEKNNEQVMANHNEQNMVSDNGLEQVTGGNNTIVEAAEVVAGSGVLDYAADKVSDVLDLLKYVWDHGKR